MLSHPVADGGTSQRARRLQLIKELEAPVAVREPDGPPETDPAHPLALAAVRAGDARKAHSMSALRVAHLTSATNFFVSMVGRSKAQINAIVRNVEDELDEQFGRRASRQGKAMSGWVCLDYDSVVVNVFSEAQSEFYGIEKYWSAAQALDLSDVLLPTFQEAEVDDKAGGADGDGDDWELDDWELEDDLDDDDLGGGWSLDDDEGGETDGSGSSSPDGSAQSVPFDWSTPTTEPATATATAPAAADDDLEVDGDDPFADFEAVEAPYVPPLMEVSIMSEEEEEAAAAAADALASDEDDDESDGDWALGDERLRRLVQDAERGASSSSSGGALEGEGAAAAGGGGWRAMMAEDGLSEDALDAELAATAEAAAQSEDDDEDESGLWLK